VSRGIGAKIWHDFCLTFRPFSFRREDLSIF
jgi:hypothetical protein